VLALHTLRFHDEVVSGDDLEIESAGRKPSKQELQMAERLVDTLEQDFDPSKYEDTYREAVLDLIKRKAKGEEIDLAEQEEPAQGDDLMGALEASLGSK
jgi:DNA end-binding protein Ku